MPIITAITPQKNQKRVNIYLDNKFAFGIDLENFVKLNLKKGQKLDRKEIESIKEKSEKRKIFDRVLKFATIRPRSKKEINDFLKRKHVDNLIRRYVLKKLKKFRLVNDFEFAKWWIEQRQAFSPKSKRILNYELRTKGIKQDAINEVLDDGKIDELKIAKELISKKEYKWKKYGKDERKQKISRYLIGKGFDWNVIQDVLK